MNNTTLSPVGAPRKMRAFVFRVRGFGQFPFDMLRYDSCHPHTQMDVARMMGDDEGKRSGQREVTLCSYQEGNRWQPSVARWQSFLWEVLP